MKKFGITGSGGKLGSILLRRANFVKLNCDVTNPLTIEKALKYTPVDLIVNCASLSSIDECEEDYQKAIDINTKGLANIHKLFGSRVLNISSDHVFDGKNWILPNESSKIRPINSYGWSKVGAEAVSMVNGGKTLRLSRTVSIEDKDISEYLLELFKGSEIFVPNFFSRNYIHRQFAADGIEYLAVNWDTIKETLIHYAGTDNVTMYSFMRMVAYDFKISPYSVKKKKEYNTSMAPRPRKGGFRVRLAESLGFPMYSITDTVSKLAEEANVKS